MMSAGAAGAAAKCGWPLPSVLREVPVSSGAGTGERWGAVVTELPLGAERPLTTLLVRLGAALDEARLACRMLRVEGKPLGNLMLCPRTRSRHKKQGS